MAEFLMSSFTLHHGKCLEVMRGMPDNSVDSIVTDPPYELGFMGKGWDKSGIANSVEMWREALRVLKPGGHLLAFSGSRTYHRMTCAIEDAGFEVRDQIMWLYGSGFPKSLDVSKAIDKAAGEERPDAVKGGHMGISINGGDARNSCAASVHALDCHGQINKGAAMRGTPVTDAARQWQGWGTALKPAHEPICVARKPLVGTVAANVLEHGTGALNIEACRVPAEKVTGWGGAASFKNTHAASDYGGMAEGEPRPTDAGRWPANLIHDGSDEVVAGFPQTKSGGYPPEGGQRSQASTFGKPTARGEQKFTSSEGSAARFFYCAKASRSDRNEGLGGGKSPAVGTGATMREREDADWKARNGNHHPTVKPTELMRYLVRLVTPPGGTVMDMFMGSGSTGKAAMLEGFRFVGIDMTAEYVEIARARIEHASKAAEEKSAPAGGTMPLFDEVAA
jgi:DNA modification methylase